MPKITLTSYGAAGEVTGSCHLLNINNYQILVDCGLFFGDQNQELKNWEKFNFDPKKIKAVVLTHAHLDHCGRLPLLIKSGFKGKVYATRPTIKIAKLILADSLEIMTEKARAYKKPALYSLNDLNRLNKLWQETDYYKSQETNKGISLTLHNAGHILGSSIVEIRALDKTIVFSGDLGYQNMTLVKDVDYLTQADYVVCESTYGDHDHENVKTREQKLLTAVQRVTVKNSVLMIALFALERTQDILKVLNDYYESHLDFNVPVFLDSPLAIRINQVYRQEKKYLNLEAQEALKQDPDILSFPHLKLTPRVRDSKTINKAPNPKIILAGSGMLEGGRMLHHLSLYIQSQNNNLLFTGYQAPGTLGHKILNGAFSFEHYGATIPVRAAIDYIDGFSNHADQSALLNWLSHFQNPQKIILVHGDQEAMKKLAVKLKTPVQIPEPNQEIIFD